MTSTTSTRELRRSPLEHWAGELRTPRGPTGVTFVERPFRVQVELRAAAPAGRPRHDARADGPGDAPGHAPGDVPGDGPGDAGERRATAELGGVLGLRLPDEVGAVARAGERHALCLGPGWWLVTDAPDPAPRLECALAARLREAGGQDVSAVDVSAQRTTIDVAGPHAADVLAHGCTLDLHPSVFCQDRCAQTVLARAQVVLHQLDARPGYRILVRSSFADHLVRWLLDAAVEHRVPGG